MAAPNEAELSRIAREAVHQPADPRLDRQLARLGVMDVPETVDPASRRTPSAPAATAADVARLEAKLARTQSILWLVVVAVGIVVVLEVIQLLR